MAPIRKGDGTPVDPKGISQVRTGDGRILFDAPAIPDALTDHYLHDEGSGTTLNNDIGSVNATVQSDTSDMWQSDAGLNGFYLQYNAADNDYSNPDDVSYFSGTDKYAWWMWINPDNPSTTEESVFRAEGAAQTLSIGVSGDSELRWYIDGGDAGNPATVSKSITSGWQFVGIVADPDNTVTRLYHAYASDSSVTEVGSSNYDNGTPTFSSLDFGRRPGLTDRYYSGGIDDIGFAKNGVLSKSDLDGRFQDTKGNY